MAADQAINSIASFRVHDICWQILGLGTDGSKYFYGIIDVFLTVFFTISYPAHLIIGLFVSKSSQETFENLAGNGAIFTCSVKFLCFRLKVKQMKELKVTLRELDKRIQDTDECVYFRKVVLRNANIIVNVFAVVYFSVVVAGIGTFIMAKEKHLLYPGWLPFDWKSSTRNFICAGCYQCLGVLIVFLQNLCNDIYPALTLCLLAGHVHLLKMRVCKLGYDLSKTKAQHNQQLIACIQDYKHLMRAYKTIENSVSTALLAQFICGGFNIGVTVMNIAVYADNMYTYLYFAIESVALIGELFPFCYYGSLVVSEFQELPYAIFSSNWLEQPKGFRKNAILFMELSLQVMTACAGGMVPIDVDSFFSTCKMAYSFFTLMITVK